jgi:hypothetical protein
MVSDFVKALLQHFLDVLHEKADEVGKSPTIVGSP